MLAGRRADVDDPVGVADHVELVLDDEQRVALRLQPIERARAAPRCRQDAGRPTARRARTPRRTGSSAPASRGAAAAARPATASACCARASGSRARDRAARRAARPTSSAMRCATTAFSGMAVARDATTARAVGVRLHQRGERASSGSARQLGDVEAGERHRQRLAARGACRGTSRTRSRSCTARRAASSSRSACCANVWSTWRFALENVPM